MTRREETRSAPADNEGGERVLALIQAGGQGSRMDVLTRERAKPALPFAGSHRLIDFALSSLASRNIPDVWVGVQYQAGSLDPHLAGGRPWDLDRTARVDTAILNQDAGRHWGGRRGRRRSPHGAGCRHRPGGQGQPDRAENHDRQGRPAGARHQG